MESDLARFYVYLGERLSVSANSESCTYENNLGGEAAGWPMVIDENPQK